MLISLFLLIAGIAMLYIGAERLVDSASKLASRFNVSPLVIGLTIVAFGTSAPELVVSVNAAFLDKGDIAIGNVIGSNIINIAFILGLAALISPLKIQIRSINTESPVMIISAILMLTLSLDLLIGRTDGLIFLSGLVLFIIFSYRAEKLETKTLTLDKLNEFIPEAREEGSTGFLILFILLSLAGLTVGAQFFVRSSVEIAGAIGISDKFIGLTVIAIGTSLPELATSVIAAMKGKADISVGNIVGSNIFNIFGIVGVTSLLHPVSFVSDLWSTGYVWDFGLMIALSILLWFLMKTGMKITRIEGVLLLSIFISYIVWLYFQG